MGQPGTLQWVLKETQLMWLQKKNNWWGLSHAKEFPQKCVNKISSIPDERLYVTKMLSAYSALTSFMWNTASSVTLSLWNLSTTLPDEHLVTFCEPHPHGKKKKNHTGRLEVTKRWIDEITPLTSLNQPRDHFWGWIDSATSPLMCWSFSWLID